MKEQEINDILRDIAWSLKGENFGAGEQYIGIGESLLQVAVELRHIKDYLACISEELKEQNDIKKGE